MKRSISLILLFFSCQITFSLAQENMSLSQAIELGLSNNYDIIIVKKNVEIAENLNTQGQAGRLPSLTFNLNQPNSASDQVQTASPFQPKGIIISNSIAPSLALNWTVFEGFKVNISKSRFDKLQLEIASLKSVTFCYLQNLLYNYIFIY